MLKITSWISWIAFAATCGTISGTLTKAALADEPAQVSTSDNELNVTRARVQQIIRALNERAAQTGTSGDFAAARAEFARKAGEALAIFEQDVEQIMTRFQPLLSRIHEVEQSTQYDYAQKRSLIGELEIQLSYLADQSEAEYQAAIARVYMANGDIPLSMETSFQFRVRSHARVKLTFRDRTVREHFRGRIANLLSYESHDRWYSGSLPGLKAVLRETGTQQQVQQLITRGCQTSSCISLMAAEWSHYMNMVHAQLDQPLQLRIGIAAMPLRADLNFLNAVLRLSMWAD